MKDTKLGCVCAVCGESRLASAEGERNREVSDLPDLSNFAEIFRRINVDIFSEYECDGTSLGEGAFCRVNVYKCKKTKKLFAGKKLYKVSEDYIHRFQREIEETLKLQHDNIIKIIVYHTEKEPYIYLMEKGDVDLNKYVKKNNQNTKDFGLEKRLELFEGILAAIKYAHSKGVIHRDLAPKNVILFKNGDSYIPKVSDFGLGKNLDSDSGYTGSSISGYGHGDYAAPEQLEQLKEGTKESDIYALGGVFSYILTGRLPKYRNQDKEGIYYDLISKTLEYNLKDRFSSVEEFEEEYLNVKNGMPSAGKGIAIANQVNSASIRDEVTIMQIPSVKTQEDFIDGFASELLQHFPRYDNVEMALRKMSARPNVPRNTNKKAYYQDIIKYLIKSGEVDAFIKLIESESPVRFGIWSYRYKELFEK